MGTKIPDTNGGAGNFAPTAFMKEEGKMIKGTLVSRRLVKTTYGDKPVYSLRVADATCEFSKGKEPVDVAEGAEVDLFAPTRLERQLVQVALGKTVTIIHTGMKKIAKGNPAHTYSVEVE